MNKNEFSFSPNKMSNKDLAPFKVIHPLNPDHSWFLTCDHASNNIPHHMNKLGLSQHDINQHIGWDIGAIGMAQEISKILRATLVAGNYSRLIVDLNRPTESETLIPEIADKITIPGNLMVSKMEKNNRISYFHKSYHNNISLMLDSLLENQIKPILVAIHSFTPIFQGFSRPWHVGLLYEHDDRLVQPLKQALTKYANNIVIGDNQPYAIKGPSDYTIPVHGQNRSLPHIEIEVRQDLITTKTQQKIWAKILSKSLTFAAELTK